jgi:hypothetical protein
MGTAPVTAPVIDPRYVCFRLAIRPSAIHRYGVYAEQRIPANRKVIEYTGQRVNRIEAKRRGEGAYTYLFAVNPYWTVDGASAAGGDHQSQLRTQPDRRVMKGHILYESRVIQPGEELTIDYNFSDRSRTTLAGVAPELPRHDRKFGRRLRPPHLHDRRRRASVWPGISRGWRTCRLAGRLRGAG